MTDLLVVCGQVRGLEGKLLSSEQLDRMVEAPDPESAFRVLVELQYAEYFDESTRPQDFTKVIEQGLKETKNIVNMGAECHEGLQFLWRRFDLNNLKRALKMKLVEGATELTNFTGENGFSVLGNLSQEDLQKIIFENQMQGDVPAQFVEALRRTQDTFEKSGNNETERNFQGVEFLLDQAHFAYLAAVVEESRDSFLSEFFQFIVNSVNFRTLARYMLVRKEGVPVEGWLPYGNLSYERAGKAETLDELQRVAIQAGFSTAVEGVADAGTDEEKLVHIERGVDQAYGQFVSGSAEGEIESIAVPIQYFEKRLQNARLIRFVMFAKFHGMDAESILNAIKILS